MSRRIEPLAWILCALLPGCLTDTVVAAQDGEAGSFSDAAMDTPASEPGTARITSCPAGVTHTNATLGIGFNGLRPGECVAPRGPDHSVGAVTDVAALLVGTWTSCSGSPFGLPEGAGPSHRAIQMTSDGHFVVLTPDSDNNLVPLTAVPSDAGSDAWVGGPSDGTFEVLDGSGTFGPNTYAVRLYPSGGGVVFGQVIITDSPRELHFFAPGAADSILIPSLPWTPFASACTCTDTTGTKVNPNDASVLAAAMTGRWISCSSGIGFGGSLSATVGVEFMADGTWASINEDETGVLSRGTSDYEHGTFTLVPASTEGVFVGPEPLTLQLNQSDRQGTLTQVIVTSSPRMMFFAVGTGGPPLHANFALLSPLP